jgi:HK97 family phage major capsid protein
MNINDLKEKRMNLINQAKEIHKRDVFGEEEKVQVDKILKDIEALESRMAILEKEEALEKESILRNKPIERQSPIMEIRDYLRSEQRAAAAQTSTTTAGGYLIPEGFKADILEAFLQFGGMYGVSQIFKTPTGNDIMWPTNDDTANKAFQINESTSPEVSGNNAALVFGQKTLKAYKWTSSLIRVPFELLEDEGMAPMLSSFIQARLRERMWRGLNAAWTTGGGSTTIEGVVTGATASGVTAAASAITKDNFYDVEASLDPAYYRNARWMLNNKTLTALKKLSVGASDDRPLWQPSVRDGAPDTILGYPYTINQDVADIGASAKSVLFGDFKHYVIREVSDWRMKRLDERFADTDQVGFVVFARYDGLVADAGTHPIKYLAHAAS